MRADGRQPGEIRPVNITTGYIKHAEGSVLVEFGDTRVICTASVDEQVPRFLKGTGKGWVTAEYGMLPRATGSRMRREASLGRQGGRTMEIQRLIGRSLRAAVDFSALGERTIAIDCDVIQADGGTRTASITGAYVAMVEATRNLLGRRAIERNPIHGQVASVSVGIVCGEAVVDLNYEEDSSAETDMNVVMNETCAFIEIQGTAEGHAFRRDELETMLDLAQPAILQLIGKQREALGG